MSNPAARLVVWDEPTGTTVDEIDLTLQAAVSDSGESVVVYATGPSRDIAVPEAWVGKLLYLEVSPKVVTANEMTVALTDLALRMGVPVG